MGGHGRSAVHATRDHATRNVANLRDWGLRHGVQMHEALLWKQYSEDNIGLELSRPVEPGTVLLRVPRALVLDAAAIQQDFWATHGKDAIEQALAALRQLEGLVHSDGVWIFLRLLQLQRNSAAFSSSAPLDWSPYLDSLPHTFPPPFSPQEHECLVPYARAAVDFQEKKFHAYCQAARMLLQHEWNNTDKEQDEQHDSLLKWAFDCASSRCWKAVGNHKNNNDDDDKRTTTEMVPIGDLFNHRDPPNVAIDHDYDRSNGGNGASIAFIYKGSQENNNGATTIPLYLSYGQPSNPHRFLVQFGFVPALEDMPWVWSHLAYANNPYCSQTEKCAIRSSDGLFSKLCWDAVLYALKEDPGTTPAPVYTREQHVKYCKFTSNVLTTHLANLLQDLQTATDNLQQISAGDNIRSSSRIPVLQQHVAMLTQVFQQCLNALQEQPRYYDSETNEVVELM